MTALVTMIVPYYRQPKMLAKQVETWYNYPAEVRDAMKIIVVDDCSPEPAEDVVPRALGVSLYRIDKDVPWNRGMARNLGTKMAETEWVLHVDTDHVLSGADAFMLIDYWRLIKADSWYRFARIRVGQADETRKKDKIPENCGLGEIHPHIDSYLCTTKAYWKAGGYNQKFAGVLGGGSPFLKEMVKAHGEPQVLKNCYLRVYTRHAIPDSSERTLPRDGGAAFAKRKRELMAKYGTLKGVGFTEDLPFHRVF